MRKEQLEILTDIFNWVKRLDENTEPQAAFISPRQWWG